MTGPSPGIVVSRLRASSSRTIVASCLSSAWICSFTGPNRASNEAISHQVFGQAGLSTRLTKVSTLPPHPEALPSQERWTRTTSGCGFAPARPALPGLPACAVSRLRFGVRDGKPRACRLPPGLRHRAGPFSPVGHAASTWARSSDRPRSPRDPAPRAPATHSLSVPASIRTFAFARAPKTSCSRTRSVRIRCSTSSPASVITAIWLSFLPKSMPIWSTASLPPAP